MTAVASTASFAIVGVVAGYPATIRWTAASGFDDPTGRTEAMVAVGEQVCGTSTGPCWPAAASPGVVAWLTAKKALDTIDSWDTGGDVLDAALTDLAAIPEGDVS